MSKKMFKRSLALGALMAFVITGSAMAAEVKLGTVDYTVDEKGVHTVHGKVYGGTGNYAKNPDGTPNANGVKADENYVYLNTNLNGKKLYIVAKNNEPLKAANGTDLANGNGITTDTKWYDEQGEHSEQRVVNIFDSSENKTGDLEIVASGAGIYGVGNIDVDELIINAGGHAIECAIDSANYDDPTLKIFANTISITSEAWNGIQANANVEIGSSDNVVKSLKINAPASAITAAHNATLNIMTDKIDVAKNKDGIIACLGATIDLKANQGNITSDVYAGYPEWDKGNHYGEVNMTLGSGVNWTGKIATDSATVSQGIVDLSGTWNNTGASSLTNATFNAGSVLKIDADTFAKDTGIYALNGVGKDAKLTVVDGAKIEITGGKVDSVYNVAKDFATNEGANWTLQADNALWYVDWTLDETANTLQGTILTKTAQDMVDTGVATNDNKEIMLDIATAPEGKNATADAINELASSDNVTAEDIQKGAAALLQVGEAGGFTGNVVSVSKQVNGSVGARNSFSGPKHGGPRHRGGHGPNVTEEANGSAIWAQYVHGKDKVDGIDMGGVENAYESQFNGVVLGADFKQVGSYASGIAFNYGEGDSHSKKNVVQSDSEFDFWGVSYYGAVKKQDTNFIFDIGYSESDSDVEQKFGVSTITANPEASTWTAGVKVEKLIDKGAVQIVPYAGLRFLTIDTDDYEAKGGTASEATYYSTERQNIWLLPVGVSLSQENVYDSGWIVTPKADLSYTWAMGDTDSSMTVNMPGVASPTTLGYTVMDDGSFMATVGLDAQKEDWTFGVAYSYQKGDSTRSDRWYVNARYSF